ncbi:S8 family serine peptidase [Shewanella surugensis]|uniref:S8 family serine peptidase n=1 Tax=Shewanella surugensis TaxID=212020 RepID=A0ABT0LCS9_9GAMM|nr:S8 family serine peptidase [Shewanella surugensis]MCL1125497.1 S8 family serine peptidase [Shewanella surugensis]
MKYTTSAKRTSVSVLLPLFLLFGCGGGDEKDSFNESKVADSYLNASQSIYLKGQLKNPWENSKVIFSISNKEQAKLGSFTITDANTGAFTYLADAPEGEDFVQYSIKRADKEAIAKVHISIKSGDPLYQQQWHLHNTGQTAFAENGGKAGEDMNLVDAIASGYHGNGIVVAVVDDGVEIAHPNLQNNILLDGSYNFVTASNDPTPTDEDSFHGTAVAGIIAAEGWNDIGGRGVAPKASVLGYNYLYNFYSEEAFDISHGIKGGSQQAHVFNQSYGIEFSYPNDMDYYQEEALNEVATRGQGSLFVTAAGNEFNDFSNGIHYFFRGQNTATGADELPLYNANMSANQANFYNLMVSALNANGTLSSYSTVGSNVFISAPGGEDGDEYPAIITTDRQGCSAGLTSFLSFDNLANVFDSGNELNPHCNYTSHMGGTSSAAPNTSGAIAVIWGANSDLTWRDIRHVLATTATQVDKNIQAKTIDVDTGVSHEEYIAVPSWTTNAAGFHFHDFYGFGRVNVSDAVKMVLNYTADLGEYRISEWAGSAFINKAIPDANIQGVSDSISITDDLIVEGVQIQLTAKHGRLPDLAVELISPSGTRSVLMTPYNGYVYQGDDVKGFDNTLMLSNAFYGEKTSGQWTLKVVDVNGGDFSIFIDGSEVSMPNEANGEFVSWSIRFHGHEAK